MQVRASKYTKIKAAISQLLCVVLVNGNENEMLSSYAWRTKNTKMILWLDGLLGRDHCRNSYEWEVLRDLEGK